MEVSEIFLLPLVKLLGYYLSSINPPQTFLKEDDELYLQNEYYLNEISYNINLFLIYSQWS